jgi:hypothetical protein
MRPQSQTNVPTSAPGSLGQPLYRFPSTIAQQALWYLDRLQPGNAAWNIAVRFRVRGPLDLSLLERAVNEVVRRHEILRTTFRFEDHLPVQLIHAPGHIPVPLDDLSALPSLNRDIEEERRTIVEASLPFDLKVGRLIRARVLRLAQQDHMLLVTMHHIVSDGWSIGIFSDEVAAHYQALSSGANANLPPLPLQYADYAVWQSRRSQEMDLEELRDYWRSKLANLPICEIPPDHPRPPLNAHRGYILSLLLPTALTDSLSEFSHRHGCTFYVTSLAVLNLLVARYIRRDDIHIGTLVAGRERLELERLIGLFINSLVLRTDLSGDPSFLDLLQRVRTTFEEALAHQDLHIQQVVEALRLKRDLSRPTPYSINFIYQRDFIRPREFAGLVMTPVPSKSPGAIYDLNFFMVQRSDGWRLSCEYNCDLYDAASVNRLLGQLRALFEEVVKNPSRRISEFTLPSDAGDPLPNFLPDLHPASPEPSAPTAASIRPAKKGPPFWDRFRAIASLRDQITGASSKN